VDDLYFLPIEAEKLYTRLTFLKFFKENYESEVEVKEIIREYKIPVIKRTFDVLVSSFALLLLSPLLITIAIAIKLESKGPIYYTSKRVGTGYRIFDFYKFRSMFTGADAKLKELEHLNKYNIKDSDTSNDQKMVSCPKCQKLPKGEYCSPTLYKGGEKICEFWYYKTKKRKRAIYF
jgi:lipopolysaccharide/colanic/teichoic acid biosynthesis glycosyltransferase